jgi:hypothetical protein
MCHFIVAGSGIEPESQGYEPCEIPLLYPAMSHRDNITKNWDNCKLNIAEATENAFI